MKHGMIGTKVYYAWSGMISRCHNERNPSYPRYGAVGVTVCDEWRLSFQAFYEYIGDPPDALHTLDRIKNSTGYQPGNVRWATRQMQTANRNRATQTSRFFGVFSRLPEMTWRAAITVNGRRKLLGDFKTALEAALVFDDYSHQLHGAKAVLNFPERFK